MSSPFGESPLINENKRWPQKQSEEVKINFAMSIQSDGDLVANAIGDTVQDEILFKSEIPLVDFSERDGFLNTILSFIPDLLKKEPNKKQVSF